MCNICLRLTLNYWIVIIIAAIFTPLNAAAQTTYHKFSISTFDANQGTDTPLGCVSVTTEFGALAITDDNGVATLYEPGLMGENLNITFKRPGYISQTTRYILSKSGSTAVSLNPDSDTPIDECAGTGVLRDSVSAETVSAAKERFLIRVFDATSDRGVPLIELQSPQSSYVTDSNGLISLDPKADPALFSGTVFFTVFGHGYQLVDPQSQGGVNLSPGANGYAEIEVEQRPDQVAHRLYRITGAGIYRDSVLADIATPLRNPTLQARISGTDWVQSTTYRNNIYRLTADTLSIDGGTNFRVTGGYSPLPAFGGMDPDLGVEPTYILDDDKGFTKQLAHEPTMPNPPGYTNLLVWTDGLWTVPESGEQMYASYRMVDSLSDPIERGIMHFRHIWSDFKKSLIFTDQHLIQPDGHSYYWWHDGSEYIYFYNTVRIPRNATAVLDPSTYQAFTALQQDSVSALDRDGQGNLIYSWKSNTPLITQEMIDAGLGLTPDESILGHFCDPDTGFEPQVHENGSTAWNHYRNRFVRVISEVWSSTSLIGEQWIAEGDTPFGPWVYARKIVTHDDYSFYNPRHHYFLDKQDGREIFFEATYSNFFTSSEKTPGYDYNQIMYKLDLADERVVLPVAIYNLAADNTESYLTSKAGIRSWMPDPPVVFMALDRPLPGTIAVHQTGADCGSRQLTVHSGSGNEPVFYALPADTSPLPATVVPLYEYVDGQNNEYVYDVDANLSLSGYARSASPIAYVWENPLSITLPVTDYLADHIADAGVDICTTEDAYQSGTATVTLNASASSHANAAIDDYDWSWSAGSASGAKPQISLGIGTHFISLATRASDGSTSHDSVIVEVSEASPTPNTAPTVTTPGTQTNTENDSITLQIVAGDADLDTLSYGATGLPAGLVIDRATGLISGNVIYLEGTSPYNVTLFVDDGTYTTSVQFSWIVNPAVAQWQLLSSDDFESGFGGWIDGGRDCRRRCRDRAYAHQGHYAVRIRDNSGSSSSFYSSRGTDLSSYNEIKIEFWYRSRRFSKGEDFLVEFWDGSSWQAVAQFVKGAHFVNGPFYQVAIIIEASEHAFNDARFRFRADASSNSDRVYIDEVVISYR